ADSQRPEGGLFDMVKAGSKQPRRVKRRPRVAKRVGERPEPKPAQLPFKTVKRGKRSKGNISCKGKLNPRKTHFAPGYIGVVWPDANASCGTISSAKEQALGVRIECAIKRKLAAMEEKSRNARSEAFQRRRHREMLAREQRQASKQREEQVRQRFLSKQLEAEHRRQMAVDAAIQWASMQKTSDDKAAEAERRRAHIQQSMELAAVQDIM
ncbi:unnamed protein product, partial [Chrysoparadoxa australica]